MIDYYHGQNMPGTAVFHVDARPALDSVASVMDRIKMMAKEAFGSSTTTA